MHREYKRPPQFQCNRLPPLFKAVEGDLCFRIGPERMAEAGQLLAQVAGVENRAVKGDQRRSILVPCRLSSHRRGRGRRRKCSTAKTGAPPDFETSARRPRLRPATEHPKKKALL